jgi:hypothetical protein
MGKLSKKINEAKNVNLDNQEIEGMIEKVKDEIESAKNNIEPMIRKMKEKISHYGCDFQLAVNNEQRENEKKEQEQEIVLDLTNNKDLLDKRRKDLEDIHSTSNQIKQMTDKMALDLKDQGAILNDIENKVIETEDNAKKSKEEIMQADKMSKSNRKRAIFFIIIISVTLIGIGAIGFGLYKYFSNK